MSRFKLLKGSRIVATADTLPEAEKYAKTHGCRVMQDASRANPSPDAHGQRARQDLQDLEWSRTPHPDDVRATDADRKAGHFEQIRRASTAFREAEHSDIPELISEAHGTLQKVYGEFMARKNGANGASYLHLTDYLANGLEHEQSAAAAVAYLTRCGYSAALAADVVEQCFSGHCDAQDAVDAAMARHGVDLPYRSNSTIEVRRNGHHPAEKWAKSDRKPAIDFGEMGQDRQALAKWLQAHPGKTAAFKAAGTVYHSAQFDGQVFTVPASRKNGDLASIQRKWMEAQERKNYAWDAIKELESAGKPVPKSALDAYNAAWAEFVAADRQYEAESVYKPRRNGATYGNDGNIELAKSLIRESLEGDNAAQTTAAKLGVAFDPNDICLLLDLAWAEVSPESINLEDMGSDDNDQQVRVWGYKPGSKRRQNSWMVIVKRDDPHVEPHWNDPRYGQEIDPASLAAIKKAIEQSRKSGRGESVTVDPQGRDSWTWRNIVDDCAKGEHTQASIDGQMLRVFTPEWSIGVEFAWQSQARRNGATHGATNRAFLNRLEAPARDSILKSIAKHYGITVREALDEVTHDEAEHLLDYMTEPERSATSVLMQRHGAVRRNGATAAPDPAHFAEYQRLFSAAHASQADKRKRLRGDLHAMSIEGPTAAEKALERFIERIGPDEWDRVTQQALRAYQ